MRTKFDLGQTVWYLDVIKAEIVGNKVVGITINGEEEVYHIGEYDMMCPASCLFSSKEGCRAFYLDLLK